MRLGVTTMYPTPINEIEEIKAKFATQAYPGARAVAERLLTVPTHGLLSATDKERLSELLAGVRSITESTTERLHAPLELGTAI